MKTEDCGKVKVLNVKTEDLKSCIYFKTEDWQLSQKIEDLTLKCGELGRPLPMIPPPLGRFIDLSFPTETGLNLSLEKQKYWDVSKTNSGDMWSLIWVGLNGVITTT